MRVLFRATALTVLILACIPARTDAQTDKPFCGARPIITDSTDRAIDAHHPKYFVEISELSSRGHKRLVHTSIPSRTGQERIICERVNAPVDIDSKIVLRINQSFLRLHHFGGKFAITARVDGASGSRPVEVPGYSVIGKSNDTDPVTVSDLSGLLAAMSEIRKERAAIDVDLAAARAKTASTNAAHQKAVQDEAVRVQALQDTVAADSMAVRLRSAAVATLEESLRRGARDTTGQMIAAQSALESIQAVTSHHADALRNALARFRNDSTALVTDSLPAYLKIAQAVLRARQHTRLAIAVITDPENASLVRTYARGQGEVPQLIVGVAKTTDSLWNAIMTQNFTLVPPEKLESWNLTVNSFQAALAELSVGSGKNAQEEDSLTNAIVIDAMRDAEITVRQTGAQVGDVLVLSISDTVGDPGADRTMEVRLPIREFGFVRRITDAVLFMTVPALHEGAELADAQAQADKSGVGSSRTVPLNLRGAPSAGVTLAWTYLPRLDDDYAVLPYEVRSLFNWLRPGVGLNASVISVAHKIITITPGKAPTEEAKDPELGYTVGVITSAFDNAIQWSVGRTLNGDKARTYTALGISFLAATDKAKELFKALAK